ASDFLRQSQTPAAMPRDSREVGARESGRRNAAVGIDDGRIPSRDGRGAHGSRRFAGVDDSGSVHAPRFVRVGNLCARLPLLSVVHLVLPTALLAGGSSLFVSYFVAWLPVT